ncbi:MAG TPA: TRAFs-binding domain-containing protein [Longimicrobium sp.]|jgi:hypothetical protein
MTAKPLCFVLMPFGSKPDAAGRMIEFDAVYAQLIAPAIHEAGLEPLRADEEMTGGIIHKPMFERLVLCEFAVVDLTSANANVFYELGVRHAARPHSTIPILAEGSRLPFDVAPLRALGYSLTPGGAPDRVDETARSLASLLRHARDTQDHDSPLFQLLESYPDVQHEKTDVFRGRVRYAQGVKDRLTRAREAGRDAVAAVEHDLGTLADQEAGVLIDLLLSYRATSAWDDMAALVERIPGPVAETVLVQEQYAFALNRAGRGDQAERVLLRLLERKGPSSETLGLLGRVYKDRWEAAVRSGEEARARGLLARAIDAYRRGFEADWRDAYPGVNAVTLMELSEPPIAERAELIPVVRYSVRRRVASGKPDYWGHATLLELAVLAGDEAGAASHLSDALAALREPWEAETTGRNLRLIREARERRGAGVPWAAKVEGELTSFGSHRDTEAQR